MILGALIIVSFTPTSAGYMLTQEKQNFLNNIAIFADVLDIKKKLKNLLIK